MDSLSLRIDVKILSPAEKRWHRTLPLGTGLTDVTAVRTPADALRITQLSLKNQNVTAANSAFF